MCEERLEGVELTAMAMIEHKIEIAKAALGIDVFNVMMEYIECNICTLMIWDQHTRGGTGIEAAPIIANVARATGAEAVVMMPYTYEGRCSSYRRMLGLPRCATKLACFSRSTTTGS